MTVCRNPSFTAEFQAAVNERQWQLETHIRGVSQSVNSSSHNVKEVLNNYTEEESLETIFIYS